MPFGYAGARPVSWEEVRNFLMCCKMHWVLKQERLLKMKSLPLNIRNVSDNVRQPQSLRLTEILIRV